MTTELKTGDWCFFEFKLSQIQEEKDGRIMSISDGFFRHSGDLSDRCFPLDLTTKRISDSVAHWSKKLHEMPNSSALNHPDIHRELVRRWVEMCKAREEDETINRLHKEFEGFCKSVYDEAFAGRSKEIEGIRIYR